MGRDLFDFATSELSQDAFICWLVAHADDDERADLRSVGQAFISWLWERARGHAVEPSTIRLVDGPHRQVKHADILFDAEVHGQRRTFLIEDKTETSQHSGQLQRYVDAFGEGRDLVPVYFKTGYHFAIDVSASGHGYAMVGLKEWVAFLQSHPIKNDIYADYLRCMQRQLATREAVLDALLTRGGHEHLRTDYAQFELMTRIVARCTEAIGGPAINHGVSIGGAPWTHYRFATFDSALPGGISEVLFHRIDARNDEAGVRRFYLSTRQYAVVKGNADAKRAKLVRLQAHAAAFHRALEAADVGLKFAKPSTDNTGANESEIGVLFFDDGVNTATAVVENFGAVHTSFVRELRRTT